MRLPRDIPPLPVLCALLLATGLNLLAASVLPAGPRGSVIAALSAAKVCLIVLGFMRLQRESTAMTTALLGYASILAGLAGLRIALVG
ncbi:hypothetical protein [Bosea vaviloviae]|jgi:hypothetical protein|uniref:Oxidase n=1 Tax=Bosea vaviloviae TaxID=1526658 RepID=A0A0N1F3K9_9HYPH|nr:hypothetical protein [Bosea vaviloviae]KPH80377.1 hypothetical protein AE618_13720 [Bosea vaviloviae]